MIIGRSSVFYADRKSKMAATTGHSIIDANHYDFSVFVQNYGVMVNSLLVTDFRLLPARNRSPFKYHCDHLDASLYVKIA